jgi:predicted O-methyltransferase YrrM
MKFSEYTITDKNTAHAYGEHFYDKLLATYQGRKINFLELGVQHGPSILAFAQTLPNATIYGIDRDLSKNKFIEQQEATGRVILHEIDLYTPKTPKIVQEKLGMTKFDIIVDDAAHAPHNQIDAFKVFYGRLNVGGTYVIEDCWDFKKVVEGLKPFVGRGTIEVVDLRKFKNKLNDDVLVVVQKYSLPTLL